MAYKIAYLKSKFMTARTTACEFQDFAKSQGVDFALENFDFESVKTDDLKKISTCDAVVLSSAFCANSDAVESLARHLNLYAKCVTKFAKTDNLIGKNVILVSDVQADDSGEFRARAEFGREAVHSLHISELEIERTARIAYEIAETRTRRLVLSDANAPANASKLWRKIVSDINEDYPLVHLEFEGLFDTTRKASTTPDAYDVILTPSAHFDAISGTLDAHNGLGSGTATICYLGETNVGAYGTERPSVFSPLFDFIALEKMLEHSFDLPALAVAWRDKVQNMLQNLRD